MGNMVTGRSKCDHKDTIKIVRVISRLNIGGPAIHVQLLTTGFDNERIDSTLVAGSISRHEGDMRYLFDSECIKPIIVPELQREIHLWNDLKAFFKIFKIIYRIKPDIVDTHTAKAGFEARTAVLIYNLLFRKKIHLIHTFHGHVFNGYFGKLKTSIIIAIERFLALYTDVIIAISDSQKRELVEVFHITPAVKIKIVELGMNFGNYFLSSSLKGEFRRKYNINTDTLLIGIVGRLVAIKNHRMLFDAVQLFLEQNPGIQVKIAVVGGGDLKDKLKKYCIETNFENNVEFYGWIKDLSPVYADFDLFALTSLSEGTPVSVMESMAAGVPVVATDAGGVKDLLGPVDIEHVAGFSICERGILCNSNDPGAFAKALQYVINENKDSKQKRTDRAICFMRYRFCHRRLLADMEFLYNKVCSKGSPI